MTEELVLHHVGFVVRDIGSSMEGFTRSLGAAWTGEIFEDPLQKVKVAFLTTRHREAQIELVEPVGLDSPVRGFLDRSGGLHHVCYEVGNLEDALARFRNRGASIAKRPKPAVAFKGRRIAWVLTPERLLIELLEREGTRLGSVDAEPR